MMYAAYSCDHPDELQIVGVADPDEGRRKRVAEMYRLPPSRQFRSAEELAEAGRIADAAINGTMDDQHVRTSLPLLAEGYDLLIEKPLAVSEKEMWELAEAARIHGRKVMVCHVLRYAPFYTAIRQAVLDGAVGRIMSMETVEHVSYHHMAVGYVRGKWRRVEDCKSPILLAKCCHDLDILAWMKSGIPPAAVSSFGSLMYFRPENAPAGAGTRCLLDCPIEATCNYSARKHYLDHPERWSFYVWADLEHIAEPTMEQMEKHLRTASPFGRCVWRCDNDQADHQTVCIEFSDGSTATHNLVGGTARPSRAIHILGTEGEIQGVLEESRFVIRKIDPRPGHEYAEETVDLKMDGDTHGAFGEHGGGDLRLVADFVRFVRGEPSSISCTSLDDSIHGHQIAFMADQAMRERRVVRAEPNASAR